MPGYLEDLTIRLAHGMAQLPEEDRVRHAHFLLQKQRADGGFSGRDIISDLYYTGFALRSLALLGELHGEPASKVAGFLQGRLSGSAHIVDFLSLMYGAALLEMSASIDIFADSNPLWRQAVAGQLESFRRSDGGYAKGPDGQASSTYHTFLVVLCYQMLQLPIVEGERLVKFILSQRRDDGGFVEIRAMRRSGTNPSAAAVGTLKILDALDNDVRKDVTEFLAEMQTDEGGLRANTRIPIADLLSTFTGTLTLIDLGGPEAIDSAAAIRYARSLEQPEGGFFGAAWDEATDVEYTFYGLGVLALPRE